MTDTPWLGDAVSLVEAFRSGERSPLEELRATFAAISRSNLNAFCYLDQETAERDAKMQTSQCLSVVCPLVLKN